MFNETKWHPEEGVYLGVTGQSSLFPQGAQTNGTPIVMTFPAKGTVPIAKQMTGTLQTTGRNVRGTGTLFSAEFKIGDYLYNNDKSVRKIVAIESDTLMNLEAVFPSDLNSATNPLKCEPQLFKAIQADSTGTAAAILQESPFAVGLKIFTGGSPIAYDASASNSQITFTVHK